MALHRRWRAGLDKLRDDMPNFAPVVDRVYGCRAVSEFVKASLRVRPMLLVGLPGLGKSCFAARLADVIGVPRFFYAMDAAETISTLAGSDKH